MEQPLDLSQREYPDNRRTLHRMETDAVMCPYVNCNCPLRHCPQIDMRRSPHLGHLITPIAHAPFGYMPGFYPDPMLLEQNTVYQNKRTQFHDSIRHAGTMHPKRRKTGDYNDTTIKSSSDDESSSKLPVSPKIKFFRPGFPMDNSESSSSSSSPTPSLSSSTSSMSSSSHSPSNISYERKVTVDDVGFKTRTRVSPPITNQQSNDVTMANASSAQREKSNTYSYMEMLPKKRIAGRFLSHDYQDDNVLKPHQYSSSTSVKVDTRNSPSSSSGSDVIFVNDRDQSCSGQSLESPSSSSASLVPKETRPKIKAAYDVSSLKADMIREIDEADRQERNLTRRKTTYIGYGRGSPNDKSHESDTKLEEDTTKYPGDIRMTALDYLISKTLLQRGDRPYKARNHHIHQIIRGEKPGKLCLMDIVELQVEIGLA